jgi:thiol-disulfide isomerase/thioredoxin/Tfp pilus assembly protein PilF
VRKTQIAVAILMLLGAAHGSAQDVTRGSAKAKSAFEQGEVARKTGDLKHAAEYYRRAIELDPNFIDAHEGYIFTARDVATSDVMSAVESGNATAEQRARFKKELDQADAQLEAEYHKWAAAHPDKAVYQWGLGDINEYKDPKAAIRYYEAALKVDPKFAPAYKSLSLMDEVQGDLAGWRENLRKAVEGDPNNPKYLFDYSGTFRNSDLQEFNRLSLEVVHRFPTSAQAAKAYYWLADAAPTDTEKLHYLELLKDDQAPAAAVWKGGGMELLFDLDEKTDRAKALALAQELLKTQSEDKSYWKSLASYAQAMVDADQLIRDGKGETAITKLDEVKLPKHYHTQQLVLMRARALNASGQKQKAYEVLLEAYAATPTDEAHAALVQYGQELGKDNPQVDADVWALQAKNARPAVPFSLPLYTSGKNLSLADFRGHVVLLNFWYPLCGPCRGEFPYIQAVLDKYKDQGFEIAAVNVEPEQDDFVLPLLKGFKLGFIPLKDKDKDSDKISDAYHVRGEPTNFLIGADGRIYFGPMNPIVNAEGQRTLELEVGALLQARHSETE